MSALPFPIAAFLPLPVHRDDDGLRDEGPEPVPLRLVDGLHQREFVGDVAASCVRSGFSFEASEDPARSADSRTSSAIRGPARLTNSAKGSSFSDGSGLLTVPPLEAAPRSGCETRWSGRSPRWPGSRARGWT